MQGEFRHNFLVYLQIDGELPYINLEPKIVKDVVLTTLILHNMSIRNPESWNVYRPNFENCCTESEKVEHSGKVEYFDQ